MEDVSKEKVLEQYLFQNKNVWRKKFQLTKNLKIAENWFRISLMFHISRNLN